MGAVIRDVLACGHFRTIDHPDADEKPALERLRTERIGTTVRCYQCTPFAGGAAQVVLEDVWLKIAPGSYVDSAGGLRLDALEMCEALNVDPTEENQELLAQVAERELGEKLERQSGTRDRIALARTTESTIAIADLVARSGARQFEVGYLRDPSDPEYIIAGPGWYCSAFYRGARLTAGDMPGPEQAADGLAHRILNGGRCTHCGSMTTTADLAAVIYERWGRARKARCIWWRDGETWRRGCEDTSA